MISVLRRLFCTMKQRMAVAMDTHRVSQTSRETAQSAVRIIRLHNAYVVVEPKDESSIRSLYLRELTLMMRRCLKLASYLLMYRKKWKTSRNT
jgi:hypothetical protein